jgi:4-amino-4-deoxy-L-arabinose transferase-like glycosyltransferase
MTTTTEPLPAASAADRRLWRTAWLLLALAAFLFLFVRGLSHRDEGRYAEVAREMIAPGGDFWQMRLMGVRYYEKPPMLYWASAVSMKLFGPTAAAARLPLLIGMAATLALCFRWSRREWGAEAARVGAAVLFTCTGFIVAMSFLLTDPLLVMFFSATCLFLFEAHRPGADRPGRWLLAAAAAAWGGVLTKGFVAIVLPGAILFFWLLWERRLRELWRWSLIPAGLLFFAALAAVLWHLERHNPDFNYRFIVQEHFQRFVGSRRDQGHPEPFWYFVPVLPALLCPWVLFIPRAIRGILAGGDLKHDSFSRFLVVWAAAVFLFFSASSGKLMSYIMPMIPPMALLIARRGVAPVRSSADVVDRRLWSVGAFLPLLCPVGVAVFWLLARAGALGDDFGPPSGVVLAPIAGGLSVLAWLWIRGHGKTPAGLLLAMAIAYVALGFLFGPLAGRDFLVGLRDNRAFCRDAARLVPPGDEVVLCNRHIPALAFYMDRVPWLYRVDDELTDGMLMEPDLPGIYDVAGAMNKAIRADSRRNFFAVVDKEDFEELWLQGLRFGPEILAEDRQLLLLRLRTP